MTNILDFNQNQITEIVKSLGEKEFRAKQVYGWLIKGVESWDEMNNVPKALRERLAAEYYIGLPTVVTEQCSKDGTRKCLYEFKDGARVESVFMQYSYGNSICISSQVGCRMGCSFCASTLNGLERNLTAGEMLGEVLRMCRQVSGDRTFSIGNNADRPLNHIVIMGMGEPFDNYEELAKFLELIHDERGFGLSYRNITVSTCGLIPNMNRFAEEFPQVNLAVSLHASNGKRRAEIMPVARKYAYDELMSACRAYTEKTGRRISFEYSMIDGVNDSEAQARELASSLKGWLTHVNLIPLNKVEERSYEAAQSANIQRFKEILEEEGVAVTVRRTLGSDIDAACGQLRSRNS
ncbi:MAG: 23S rRNA (adenine(2503)-C(2))-methyltransferase RlmN [Clostridiales bacterium]|nr:23S rRNA (adenine(2503)-C(2))-methyltransferase RlmN [Candidatus Crickella caballi]